METVDDAHQPADVSKRSVEPPAIADTIELPDGLLARDKETILLVEDEDSVRALKRILERGGYNVVTAKDGEHASQIFHGNGTKFDLVVTDVVMPHMNGPAFAREIIAGGWSVDRVLFVSGWPWDPENGFLPEDIGRIHLVSKPIGYIELIREIRNLLDKKR
jgi:two-component system cell cycle sensor histidine kinase/response regulator CckA